MVKRDDGLAETDPRVRQRYSTPWEAGDSALTLLEHVREHVNANEVLTWFRERIVVSGWMRKRDPRSLALDFEEPGAGRTTVPLLGKLDAATDEAVVRITHAANRRVLAVLRELRDHPDDRRLATDAKAEGRVREVDMKDGGKTWGAVLREGQSMSTWILSLVAADLLAGHRDYGQLGVCDVCDTVFFAAGDKRKCGAHRERPK